MQVYKTRVYLEDTDRFGVVYHATYVKFFERARIEWLRQRGCSLEQMYQAGFKLVVSNLEIRFLKTACLDDELVIETSMDKFKMSMAFFSQSICSTDNKLIAKAKVKIVALDKDGNLCHISKFVGVTTN